LFVAAFSAMAQDMRVFVFGDQSGDVIPELRELVSVKDNPLLLSFFQRAYITLRDEVAHHPQAVRGLPGFVSVENLLWRYSESGIRNPAIESALVCIHQIASLLR
jgi:naphtho-gamma-pyrone polyketide synthase